MEQVHHIEPRTEANLESALFGFVQRYVWNSVLLTFGMLAIGITLTFCFQMDVAAEGTGQLRPQSLVPAKARISGLISTIGVEDGQTVGMGDTLFAVDTREEHEQLQLVLRDITIQQLEVRRVSSLLENTRSDIAQERNARAAELSLEQLGEEQARLEWEVSNKVFEATPSATPYSLRLAQARTRLAQIHVDQAASREAELRALGLQLQQEELALRKLEESRAYLQQRIQDAVVLAAEAGTVTARDLKLRRGDQVTQGEPILEIVSANRWLMRTLVSDKVLPYLRKDQVVRIYLDAFPYLRYRVYQGKVQSFSLAPSASGDRNQYLVEVALEDRSLTELIQGGLQLNGLRGRTKFVLYRKTVAAHLWDYVREQVGKLRVSAPS